MRFQPLADRLRPGTWPAADLDHPMTLSGIEARRFGIKHDLAHLILSRSPIRDRGHGLQRITAVASAF